MLGIKPVEMAVVIGVLIFALLYPFVDQNYLNNYQWDTPVFATHVAQFRQTLATGNLKALPPLQGWPQYFDAYDVLLTILTAATAGVGRIFPIVTQMLPTVEIQTNFWARWMSLGFHCIGMAFLWLALLRLYARPLVALSLALLVALAPTLIDMDLGRNDWGVIGSLCAVVYFNIRLAQGDQRRSVLIGLGVFAGLLVTFKLNGPAFVIFVASALLSIIVHRGMDVGRIGVLLVVFMLTVIFLSVRQIYYLDEFFPNLIAQIDDLNRRWFSAYPKSSLFYYAWGILESQGKMYRLLIWGSAPVVLLLLFLRISLTSVFVFGSFGVFVILSLVVDYGFARGGYHLLPLFVMMIAVAFGALESALRAVIRRPRLAGLLAGTVVAGLLAEPLLVVGKNYAVQAARMYNRPSAVFVTRTLPAKWMGTAFRPGTRMATIYWNDPSCIPPIHNLGFVFDNTLLVKLGGAEHYRNFDFVKPPSLNGLRSTADVLIVTDWQQNMLNWLLRSLDHPEAVESWKQWLETMRREVPSVVFSASSPGYCYRRVEIFVLDPTSSAAALRATLTTLETPVEVRGP